MKTVSHELGHSILDLPHDVVSCYPDTLMTNHSCGTNSCEEREILGRWDSSVPTYGGEGLFLSCHHRRLLGWPTGGDTPPCGEYPPLSPGTVTAVAGEAQVTATWTAPTFTAGAPVTGYRVELYKGTVVQECEGGYGTDFNLEAVYETGPDARTHTFDVAVGDTFPYDEYFVDVYAVSGRGKSADASSDYVRPTPANSVQVTDLGPRGLHPDLGSGPGRRQLRTQRFRQVCRHCRIRRRWGGIR